MVCDLSGGPTNDYNRRPGMFSPIMPEKTYANTWDSSKATSLPHLMFAHTVKVCFCCKTSVGRANHEKQLPVQVFVLGVPRQGKPLTQSENPSVLSIDVLLPWWSISLQAYQPVT